MKNLWNDDEANRAGGDALALRVYTSRLLGADPDLVLHGGGNTSVKAHAKNLFGESEEVLYVKGSGWDLATIEAAGFAPVKMDTLLKMAKLKSLTDTDMVKGQRSAMTEPSAPNPSVEAILHALIPFTFVDHTHADAVVTITNTPNGEERIRDLFGDRVLVVPYVMPGFILSRTVYEMTRDADWSRFEGMILMHHGIFTFADDGKTSYDRMISLVTEAEDYLAKQGARIEGSDVPAAVLSLDELKELAGIRNSVSGFRGKPMIVRCDFSANAQVFSNDSGVDSFSTRGPLTPDHVIRTKRIPVVFNGDASDAISSYAAEYQSYFARNATNGLTCLDPAPRWGVWPGQGTLSFGQNVKEADIIADIVEHTRSAILSAEKMGGWKSLPEQEIFEVEYWELEQAKLKKAGGGPELQGKIAVITGGASGIGRACAEALRAQGAAVAVLDINPQCSELFSSPDAVGIPCDVTDRVSVDHAVAQTVQTFGGIDILVSNAGIFTSSRLIEEMDDESWENSVSLNLTSHRIVLQSCVPFLKEGVDPAVVVIASKNVPAPGPGASAYSAAKAGLTQLARIAALELAPHGIRVNMLHPDAVFDTGLWTQEMLAGRAASYGLSVDDYKRKNLLRTEIRSADVGSLAAAMAGSLFGKTTGAQIPVDGGNDRVI